MATVTGYTSAKMDVMEKSNITDGYISGDDLILVPEGYATEPGSYPEINAGNVRGPQGIQGPTGEVTTAAMTAAIAAAHAAGAITETQIATGAITNTKLGADAVTSAKIADLSVGQEHIKVGAINVGHMQSNSIDSAQYVDGSIDAAHIASGAVTNAKIGSGAVTSAKIASGAVGTTQLDTSAVTNDKIALNVIEPNRLAKFTHKISRGSATLPASSLTTITWTSETPASSGWWTSGTNLIAPSSGLFAFSFRIILASSTTSPPEVRIWRAGEGSTEALQLIPISRVTNGSWFMASANLYWDSSEILVVGLYNTTGSSQTLNSLDAIIGVVGQYV